MLPIIVLNLAWAEAKGWSPSESAALLLDIDRASAIPAGVGDVCPQCGRHPAADSEGYFFDPESATATPERVKGRAFVRCLCGTVYSFAAVHEVDVRQPIGEASVRATSASQPVAPPPPPAPAVVTNFREVSRFPIVLAAVGQQPPPPQPLPPGRVLTTPPPYPRPRVDGSFIFGVPTPLRARTPLA